MRQEFSLYDDGIRLDASLDVPEDRKKQHPLLLIIHGFTGNRNEPHLAAAAEAAVGLGFAALRADLYGHGSSEGSFRDHTILKWLSNILKLTDWAREKEAFTDLYLCGHSQGGLAVLLAAAIRQDCVKGVIAMAPALTIPERAREGIWHGLRFDPDCVPESISIWDRTLGGNYIRTAQLLHTEDILRYEGPVLFVHGSADEVIPPEVSADMAGKMKNARLALIPGEIHDYEKHLDETVGAVRDWLSAQISAQ